MQGNGSVCEGVSEPIWDYVGYVEGMRPKSKDRPRFSHGVTYTPKETQYAEQEIKKQLLACGARRFEGPCEVMIECFFLRPKKPSKPYPRGDVDNFAKLVLDAVQPEIILDDHLVVSLICKKSYSTVEGYRIRIREIKDEIKTLF